MPTNAFMVRDVHTCKNEDRAVDIAKVMAERRIRHVPIVDDGYLAVSYTHLTLPTSDLV